MSSQIFDFGVNMICENMIVKYCSPTLAGIKTANMFSCCFSDKKELCGRISYFNSLFCKKGLRLMPLQIKGKRALLYLYRPAHLLRDLKNSMTCRILRELGYCTEKPESCVAHLVGKLRVCEGFPHEIGFFLVYPPEDVSGFINNSSKCKFVGCWKVYGDEETARKLFDEYQKCTNAYSEMLGRGLSVEHLAIADGNI